MPGGHAKNATGRQLGANLDGLITSLDTTDEPRIVPGCHGRRYRARFPGRNATQRVRSRQGGEVGRCCCPGRHHRCLREQEQHDHGRDDH